MRVVINSCSQVGSDTWSVTVTSPHGRCQAAWHGKPPMVGQQYDVELEIPDSLAWEKEITPASESRPAIGVTEDGPYLIGLLEQAEEDGCVTVRVGSSIVLLEATGRPLAAGHYIKVRFDRLVLFDTGL